MRSSCWLNSRRRVCVASNNRDCSSELAHVFSPCVSYGLIARTDAQRAVGFIRLGCIFNI
jgi:hypothetical protein